MKEHAVFITKPQIISAALPSISFSELALAPLKDNNLDMPTSGGETKEMRSSFAVQNPTMLSDRFANTLAPILIIRNPVRMIPSWYKASLLAFGASPEDSGWHFYTSYKWLRLIFDYYSALYGSMREGDNSWPLVVDGDELVNNAEHLMLRFCNILEMDSSTLQFTWEPQSTALASEKPEGSATSIERNRLVMREAFGGTFSRSTGVIKDKVGNQELYLREFN